jgi:type VI secretion system protein VasI
MFKKLCMASFILLPYGALAETKKEANDLRIAGCARIENSVNRLACFDDLSKTVPPITLPTADQLKSQWEVSSERSKINDRTNVFISLKSTNQIPDRFRSITNAEIVIACNEGKTDIYLTLGKHFLADIEPYGIITMRFDNGKAQKISMQESGDNSALGKWNSSGIKFIKSLFSVRKLFARVFPYRENGIDVEFDLTGLETEIRPLRQACKW